LYCNSERARSINSRATSIARSYFPNGNGKIEVQATDWQTRQAIEDYISPFVDAALKGIEDFAKQYSSDLSCCDIVVSNFLYHPIDSSTKCYYQAGRIAFRAALEAWKIRDLDIYK
jgi:hypothetical protein